MNNLTKRQKLLLKVAILNLEEINSINGIENFTKGLNYDDADQDLSCLAEDMKIEFNL